ADDGGEPPDGGTSNTATVTIQVGGPQVVHSFPMDNDPGWSTDGAWAFGQPTGGGSFNGDPTSGFTGPNVYGYNLNGDYTNNMPLFHLTTAAIDCSAITGAELRFWRWLGVESATWDHADIQVSNDGTSWTTIWEHTGGAISDASWLAQTFDISAVADGRATVYLRWGMGPTDSSVTYPGWNIDDVEIWGIVPVGIPADVNGDGVVDVLDLTAVILAWGLCPGCPEDINGDGVVNVLDLVEVILNWGAGAQPAAAGSPWAGKRAPAAERLAAGWPEPGLEEDVFVNDSELVLIDHGGVLDLAGGYLQRPGAVLSVEVAGTVPVIEHDLLVVAGTARLDGVLDVALLPQAEPGAGDRLALIAAGVVVDRFAEVQVAGLPDHLRAEVVYGHGGVVLEIVAEGGEGLTPPIPEPDWGDLTGDGIVDVRDVRVLLAAWEGAGDSASDLNHDGVVDGLDLQELLSCCWSP
ncbi:MAG: hypothetical protein ACYTGC_16620, partial [Planctomycetota bacterium]